MRRATVAALATIAVLAGPGVAAAGGWATVQLSSTPTGIRAGETWSVNLTVLQHGVTRLDDVRPEVRISAAGRHASFPALPTGRAGEYHANVVFPGAGAWRFAIWDGFSRTHSYAPVTVGDDGGSSARPWIAIIAGACGAAAAALLVRVLRRRGSPEEPVVAEAVQPQSRPRARAGTSP